MQCPSTVGLNPNLHIVDMHSVSSFTTSLSNVESLPPPTIDLLSFFILIWVLSIPSCHIFLLLFLLTISDFRLPQVLAWRFLQSTPFPFWGLKNYSNSIASQNQIRTEKLSLVGSWLNKCCCSVVVLGSTQKTSRFTKLAFKRWKIYLIKFWQSLYLCSWNHQSYLFQVDSPNNCRVNQWGIMIKWTTICQS